MNKNENLPPSDVNRRDFIKNSSLAALLAAIGAGSDLKLKADVVQTNTTPAGFTPIPAGPLVKFGVIGLGEWGREIVKNLAFIPNAQVTALCDTYEASLKRAGREARDAQKFDDYKQLLASKDVDAVVVATPTHLHKQIVLDALAADKHVYCEAPLANTVDDARAIAAAAKAAVKVVFQPGLQERSHPQRQFLVPFIRGGAAGTWIQARGQWHKKDSWRRTSPNPEHEQALNWRLTRGQGLGLSEVTIHQFDAINWFLRALPTEITGFNSLILWKDGRNTPDTEQSVFEYPGGVRLVHDASLCTSFDNAYELYYGADATIMYRDEKAWLFKEVDAALLGWEVYARKDTFYTETGIALTANATKQAAINQKETAGAFEHEPLYYALAAFKANVGTIAPQVKSYVADNGDDLSGLPDIRAGIKLEPAASWQDGLEATIVAVKACEAILGNTKVSIDKQLFQL
jgi:predicted dehydrogenase